MAATSPGTHRYVVAGQVFEAPITLPELVPATGTPAWTFELAPVAPPPGDAVAVPAGADADWIRIARTPDGGFVLEFEDLARFALTDGGTRVACAPAADLPEDTLRHLLLDHVLPRVLALRGRHVLHASAVLGPRGVIGFVGATGWGKSTLAVALARAGLPLLGDDALIVDRGPRPDETVVWSTYPGVRLWPEDVDEVVGPEAHTLTRPVAHYTSKVRVGRAATAGLAFRDEPAPLARLYVLDDPELDDGETVAIEPLSPQQAFVALARHTFRMETDDPATQRVGFERLAASPALAACARLTHPRDRARTPDVVRAILADQGAP